MYEVLRVSQVSVYCITNLERFLLLIFTLITFGWHSSLGGYGLDDQGSIPGKDKIFFSQAQRSDRLWGPPSLLFNENRGRFPGGKTARVGS
jgi:hypothetical protein